MYTLVIKKLPVRDDEDFQYQTMWLSHPQDDEGRLLEDILSSMNELVRNSLFRYRQLTLPEPTDSELMTAPLPPLSYTGIGSSIIADYVDNILDINKKVYLWVDEHGLIVKDLRESEWLDKSGWKKVE